MPPFLFRRNKMTLSEAKRKIQSLGFEEEETIEEYNEIVIDSLDRAVQYIYDSTVRLMIPYYTRELSTEEEPWTPVRPTKITDDTSDDHIIEIPDDLVELIPLLAAYHIWLDDDERKATMYYNNFVQKRDAIIESNMSTAKATIMPTITGTKWFGVGW